jgi:hypothetical protein
MHAPLFCGRHFPDDVISLAVRWYLRYSLSYRDLEEILAERGRFGGSFDRVTVGRPLGSGTGATAPLASATQSPSLEGR